MSMYLSNNYVSLEGLLWLTYFTLIWCVEGSGYNLKLCTITRTFVIHFFFYETYSLVVFYLCFSHSLLIWGMFFIGSCLLLWKQCWACSFILILTLDWNGWNIHSFCKKTARWHKSLQEKEGDCGLSVPCSTIQTKQRMAAMMSFTWCGVFYFKQGCIYYLKIFQSLQRRIVVFFFCLILLT